VSDRSAALTLEALQCLFGEAYAREFSIRLWTGTTVAAAERARFTLAVNAPYGLRSAFAPPIDLNPGSAYANGLIDILGDLESGVDALMLALMRLSKPAAARLAAIVARLPSAPGSLDVPVRRLAGMRHSRRRDAAAVGFHYDQPTVFFRSFLDENLVYSCGYYDGGATSLGEAQLAKIDYILEKLQLEPGERLLDIGCGWGALVMRAAEKYGAYAFGITLSRGQYKEARRRIVARGLSDRATVELWDYRDLGALEFDKVASVGMIEHVGRERTARYFAAAFRALRPGGLFLNHGIADQSQARRGERTTGFIDRYIFPDGDLLPVSETLLHAERAGFELRDVENLRENYTRTIRAWLANLERNAPVAITASSERTYRTWRLYLAGSAQGFRSGRLSVFQSLLAKPLADGSVEMRPRRAMYERAVPPAAATNVVAAPAEPAATPTTSLTFEVRP
jgi:cyclopropane-fatty-acyl-phospholipid synthase